MDAIPHREWDPIHNMIRFSQEFVVLVLPVEAGPDLWRFCPPQESWTGELLFLSIITRDDCCWWTGSVCVSLVLWATVVWFVCVRVGWYYTPHNVALHMIF